MNWGERFQAYIKTGKEKYKDPKYKPTISEEETGAGAELAEQLIHPQKAVLKSAIKKVVRRKKRKKKLESELKKLGKGRLRVPKIPKRFKKRMRIKLKPVRFI